MFRRGYLAALLVVGSGCAFDPSGLAGRTGDDAATPDARSDGAIDAAGDALVDAPGVDGAIDATVDATVDASGVDAFTDSDGDGIDDSVDNCPDRPNANQRNHDGDARGDSCDGCPHLAETNFVDSDGDLVDDDCDPRPNNGGDRIANFDGFYDSVNGPPLDWQTHQGQAGDWSISGGELVQGDGGRQFHLIAWQGESLTHQAIDARFTVTAVAGNAAADTIRSVGIAGSFDPSANGSQRALWGCVIRDNFAMTSMNPAELRLQDLDADLTLNSEASAWSPAPLEAGQTFRLRLILRNRGDGNVDQTCQTPDGTIVNATTVVAADQATTSGFAAIIGYGVAARFDYVVIYDLAGP